MHFAVDPYLVYMTGELAGGATRFLPFNRGHDGGKGNPVNPDGYDSELAAQVIDFYARKVYTDLRSDPADGTPPPP